MVLFLIMAHPLTPMIIFFIYILKPIPCVMRNLKFTSSGSVGTVPTLLIKILRNYGYQRTIPFHFGLGAGKNLSDLYCAPCFF
jgi:hypothetical protein